MNWQDYVRDQAGLFFCVLCVALFVGAMAELDNTLHMDTENLLYMIGVCFFFFLL